MNYSKISTSIVGRAVAGLLALSVAASSYSQSAKEEKPAFTATVTSFQTYLNTSQPGIHYIAATVHVQNKLKEPLILGYSRKGISGSDEQGNRYALDYVRGMGEVSPSGVDPKFVLPPGGGGDMFVQLSWRSPRNAIFGITFDFNLALRALKKLPSNQYEMGPETPLEFTGFKSGFAASLENVTDPVTHMVNAGPFKAQIVRTKFGPSGRWVMIADFTVRLENTSDRPIILACEQNSVYGSDDLGNLYGPGSGSSTDIIISGIGLVNSDNADPQFVLAPGESKDVHFTTKKADHRVLGTIFTYYMALQELEILPSKQIREVRQYSLTFPAIPEK